MNLYNTGCKSMALAEATKKNLVPLVIYKDQCIVPDWDLVNRGRPGWNQQLANLRILAFQRLSGQQPTNKETSQTPGAATEPMFDITAYTKR